MSISEKSFNEKSPAGAGLSSKSGKIIGRNQYKAEASRIQVQNVELNRYSRLNWPIFPVVHGGKVPATQHGFRDASRDPEVIHGWFGTGDYNIGLPTGVVSGVCVLDVDPRNGGDQS